MKQLTKQFALSASALAAALLITACGGGASTDDTTAPTVAISAAVGAGGATTFTFVFSEDVGTSFVVDDVVVTGGGTVGAFAKVSATNYTLIVTPPSSSEGTLAVSVAASKFKDVALNDNTVAAESSQAFDTSKLATFDETVALTFVGFDGAEATSIAAGPTGGTGNALKIIRTGGQAWAGAKLTGMTLGVTSTKNTFSARVHSPTAGIPFVLKLEGNGDTGDITANETVVVGWQTLTWTVPSGKIGPVRSDVVFMPNLGALGSGEIYYVDDVKLIAGTVTTTVAPSLATFDETVALTFVGFDGAEATSIAAGPTGGTGNALKIIRTGGQVWAGAKLTGMTLGVTSTKNTFSARVHSPTAGIPFILKLEGNGDTGDITANETVVVGWQTLTWTVPSGKIGPVRSDVVFMPNLGALGSGQIYYVDDVKLITGTTPLVTPPVVPSTELVFSTKYYDRAAGSTTEWISAEGGFAGRYIDDSAGAESWWNGIAPNDTIPSFYFGYGAKSATKPWGFGAYVSAPNNGSAAVSSYTNFQISIWGNDELVSTRPNFTVLLQGAPVNGCTAKVKGNIAVVANGAQTYTLPLSGFSLEAACAYSSVSQVLAGGVAEVHLQVLGSNLQYTKVSADKPGFYANGLNVGPIKFK
jgi:hypothetical protein